VSKTLVLVLTHPGASDILERNWPHILKCECDVGVVNHWDPNNDSLSSPLPFFKGQHVSLAIGTDPSKMPHRYVSRFMDVLQWCVDSDLNYRRFCLIESDVIFVRPLPEHPGGMVATLSGYRSEGFHGEKFWHCPWWISHLCAEKILRWGKLMLACGLDEQGFIDRFLGLQQSLYPLQITESGWYSRNTILPEHYAEARTALERGAVGCHGVKTEECLRALTEGL